MAGPVYLDDNGNPLPATASPRPVRNITPRGPARGPVYLDDDGNPTAPPPTAQRAMAARPRRGQAVDPRLEAAGGLAALGQGLTLGFSDEMTGALGAIGAAGDAALHGRFSDIPRAAGEGYNRERDRTLALAADFNARRPNAANLAQGTGMALPMLATMGGAAGPEVTANVPAALARAAPRGMFAQTAAGRGLPAWAAQTARGAATGGAYGAIYGAGTADDGQRLQGAAQGGENGAILGALAPTAVNAVKPAASLATTPLRTLLATLEAHTPLPEPGTLGALGGNLRMPPPAPPPGARPPFISPTAVNTIDRLADRNEMSADEVARQIQRAQDNPQGQVLADVFNEPGRRTVAALGASPGRTSQRIVETARARAQAAPGRIIGALQRGLNVGESRTAAMTRLGREYDTASANLYKPVFEQPTTPEMRQQFSSRIGDALMDDPVMVRAEARAGQMFARDRRLNLVRGDLNDNLPRYLHYVKMGLDDAISSARRDPNGIQATEMRGVMELRNRFVSAMDDIIPGYRQAREQWGGLHAAEDALDEGANWLKMQPEEVQQRVGEMTPFELQHARIGLVDEIRHATRGGVNRNVNVARALDDPDMQKSIAAAFDSPEQAAAFLDTVNTQYELLSNAGRWQGGSSTASNVLHAVDEHLHTGAEMAGHMAEGNAGGAIRRGLQGAWNAVRGGALERANNQRGETLLHPIDTPQAQAFANEVVRLLRQRQAARAAGAQLGRGASGIVGTQLPQRRDRQ